MRGRQSWTLVLLLTVISCAPLSALSKELEDRKWLEVRTDNFEIRSMLSKKETLKLAQHLEVLRVVAALYANAGLKASPIPTEIYAISGSKAAAEFAIAPRYSGKFSGDLRGNRIIVKDSRSIHENAVMMHEYVHFLIRNYGTTNYPMWFHEGFAEYLSSLRIRSKEIIVGGVPPEWAPAFANLSWIPISIIIGRRGGEDWPPRRSAMFYAESWALVHFLQHRIDKTASFNDQLSEYVQRLDAGEDPVKAFEEVLGMSHVKLDREVRKHIAGKRVPVVSFPTESLMPSFEPEVRRMTREQISLALAQDALSLGNYENAERRFRIAESDTNLAARAAAGLGALLMAQEQFEDAKPYFEHAIELAPDDAYCQLDMANFWLYRAQQSDDPSQRDTFIDLARTHYVNAWNVNPKLPETYAMYGRSFLLKGDDNEQAIVMLEEAQRLLRSSIEVKLSLAEAYLRADRMDDAGIAARSVLSWSHGESDAAARAREILAIAAKTGKAMKGAADGQFNNAGLFPPKIFDRLTSESVAPGAVFLASQGAPSRCILAAGGGAYALHKGFEMDGISLLPDKNSAEGIAAAWDTIAAEEGMQEFTNGYEQAQKFAIKNTTELGIES